jgi:hypothetical protein
MSNLIGELLVPIRTAFLGRLLHGPRSTSWGPFAAKRPAVIDAGFVEQMKQGRIQALWCLLDLYQFQNFSIFLILRYC